MALVLDVNNIDNSIKKCGDITTRGLKEFFLVCSYCDEVFLKLDDFIAHMRQQHLNNVYEKIKLIKSESDEYNDSVSKASKSREEPSILIKDEQPMDLDNEMIIISEIEQNRNELKDPFTMDEHDYVCGLADTEMADSDLAKDVKTTEHHDLLKDKDDITIAIITEYEKHPVLWSKDYPPHKYRIEREKTFQEVVHKVNKQFNCHLKWKTVRDQIRLLRRRHVLELQNKDKRDTLDKPFIPTWHANLLKFLNPMLETNQDKFIDKLNNESRYADMTQSELEINSEASSSMAVKQHNLLEDKDDITTAIIGEYKKHPLLWSKKHPFNESRPARKEAFQQIVSSINEQFNCDLEWKALRLQISNLLNKYSSELKNLQKAESEGRPFIPSWHANQLHFLNPKKKTNQHKYESNDSADYSDIDQSKVESDSDVTSDMQTRKQLNLLKDKNDMTIAIITEYKMHPVLWSKDYPPQANRVKRVEALQEIANNVNKEFNSDLEWESIKDQLLKLRKKHRSELQQQKKAKSEGRPFTPSWHANQLNFLHPKKKTNQHRYENNDSGDNLDIDQSKIESDSDVTSDMEVTRKQLNLLKDKNDMTIAIIAEFKMHPVLWSNDYPPQQNRVKRVEALRQIANNVNDKFNSDLEWESLREQLLKLRKKHRAELQQQKKAKSEGRPFTPSWHADLLEFLNPGILYYKDISPKCSQSALLSSELDVAENIKLFAFYKRYPCLWDIKSIEYRFNNRRQEALIKMQEALKDELEISLTQAQLQSKISLIRDVCSQEKKRKFECERTKELYIPSCQYSEHMLFLLDNVGPFKCEVCEQLCITYDTCLIHKSTHDGTMPFICPICNKGFVNASNYTVHLRRHKRDYPYECETCKKRFATSTDRMLHMSSHTGEKRYFCEICGQSFRTGSFLDHRRRHEKKPRLKCSICSKAFYRNFSLIEHMKTHLNVRDKLCNVCGKKFKSTKYLRQHKQIHAEKKNYVCRICKKDFAQYAGLSGHMKTHGTTLVASGFINIGRAKYETVTN